MTNQEIMQYTGEGVFVLLLLILFLKPIAYYLKKPKILIIRRYLGWITGLLVFTHVLYWALYYMQSITFLVNSLSQPWFLLGVFAMLSIFLMSITSNDWSVKWLKRKWKKIHVVGTHVAIVTALIHAHLAIRGYDQTIWLWAVPLITLLIWRIKAESLRSLIAAIGVMLLCLLIASGNFNVVDVVTEVAYQETIDDNATYTRGYWGTKLQTWITPEAIELCGSEDNIANLDTRERVYCKSTNGIE